MKILAIKTNDPIAELYLFEDQQKIAEQSWEAGRSLAKDLLGEIEKLVGDFEELDGVVVYRGPGSFTGLRIGITTANTLAYGQGIAIVGTETENWISDGIKRLENKENDQIVLPFYGGEANITPPKK